MNFNPGSQMDCLQNCTATLRYSPFGRPIELDDYDDYGEGICPPLEWESDFENLPDPEQFPSDNGYFKSGDIDDYNLGIV